MAAIRRVSIDDVLKPGDPANEVRGLDAVRAAGVALDQVVNRAKHEAERWGKPDPIDSPANAGDLEQVARQIRILETAADRLKEQGQRVVDQFPKPAPKKAGKRASAQAPPPDDTPPA